MVDTIDEQDVARIDSATDPSAFQPGEIESELRSNPNLSGEAVRAFADRIADKREPVREEAEQLMAKRLSPNPANPSIIQLRKQDGTLGPRVPEEGDVSLDLSDSGRVTAEVSGETVDLGTVDLHAGSTQKRERRMDRTRTPEQRPGGGR